MKLPPPSELRDHFHSSPSLTIGSLATHYKITHPRMGDELRRAGITSRQLVYRSYEALSILKGLDMSDEQACIECQSVIFESWASMARYNFLKYKHFWVYVSLFGRCVDCHNKHVLATVPVSDQVHSSQLKVTWRGRGLSLPPHMHRPTVQHS